jgi:hypothetical protein
MDDDGFYDDAGRWWPNNAEWCDKCQGMGTIDCDCGGDFCVCGAYDSLTCPRCDGEGYFVPSPAFLKARAETARWWRELNESLACDSGSGSQSEDAPKSAAEAEGPQSGAAKTAHRPTSPRSLDKEESR